MISFSTNIATLLQNPSIECFYVVKIGTYKTTSYFTDITLSNNETYLSDGKLVNVDPPRLSSSVDREIYKVVLADADYSLGTIMQSGLVGSNFEVRLIFIDPTTNLPYTTLTDTVLSYKGDVDSIGYSVETGNSGQVLLEVSGASPMADLDLTKAFYTSKEYIRGLADNSQDSCFDQVYEGSGPVAIKWGKV
jgi:hypothetical protein